MLGWAEELDDVDTAEVAAQLREHADEIERAGRAIAVSFAELVAESARRSAELAG